MKCYLFDLDGTLCDLSHRLPLIKCEKPDWDAFFDACHADTPIMHVVDLCRTLTAGSPIVFVSGRAERSYEATRTWLIKQRLYGPIYMRQDGDHRPDHVIKLELLARVRKDGYEPVLAFEDRDSVVRMWRAAGIPCAQVAEGNF